MGHGGGGFLGSIRGVVAMWNPMLASFHAYYYFGGILLSGHIQGYKEHIQFINLYAPYSDQNVFWKRMEDNDILKIGYLVTAGDFNATLS